MKKLTRKGMEWEWTTFHKWKDRYDTKIDPIELIGRDSKIFGMGSCFAANVISFLQSKVDTADFFPETRFYDILSVWQALEHLFVEPQYDESNMWRTDQGQYAHPFRSPNIRYGSVEELMEADKAMNETAKKQILDANVVIVTLGGTEIWRHPQNNKAYATIPFPDVFNSQMPQIAEFHNLNFQENYECLLNIYRLLQKINPKASLIYTVSPNRMTFTVSEKDVVQATSQGKSVLRAAVGELTDTYKDRLYYFHSYELLEYADYPEIVYDQQFRHVNDFAVSVVMSEFMKYYGCNILRDELSYQEVRRIYREKEGLHRISEINEQRYMDASVAHYKRRLKYRFFKTLGRVNSFLRHR